MIALLVLQIQNQDVLMTNDILLLKVVGHKLIEGIPLVHDGKLDKLILETETVVSGILERSV